jgi:23S rRNA (cytidine1920-2'-O)/16S rRNA (cytidine1409-2'-O)-methyltransferase
MSKARLDVLMVERGLAESRAQAQRLVMAGQVRVEGQMILKPAVSLDVNTRIELEEGRRFVSRGGEKLETALLGFGVPVQALVCADVGASTGGFTDCLLQHGAAKVYAIDVGQGILHWKLRQDKRVVVLEKTNARYLACLPEPVALVTVDASFISLKILLPVVRAWLGALRSTPEVAGEEGGVGGEVIALIKPQFEAGRKQTARGHGVIRDPIIHRQILVELLKFAQAEGYGIRGLLRSPLLGPKGNTEFLAWLEYPGSQIVDPQRLVDQVVSIVEEP